MKKQRLLTGIKPTGSLHLGNYFGVFKSLIEDIERQQDDFFVFIANLHALNTTPNPADLSVLTYDLALDLLSLGLDPEKCVFFVQSDVKAHTDLTWILLNLINMGALERAHAYKDAVDNRNIPHNEVNVGLFTYPVLMAADIIMYEPDFVPVGQDQVQHVEIARDFVTKLNNLYKANIKLPEIKLEDATHVYQGIDGRKMSKSYDNFIPVFAPRGNANMIKKRIMSIQTDSKMVEDIKDPFTCNVFKLYESIASSSEIENMKDRYLAGGYGYGDAKKELLRVFDLHFEEANLRRSKLLAKPDFVREVLAEGGKKAAKHSEEFMLKLNTKIGLTY